MQLQSGSQIYVSPTHITPVIMHALIIVHTYIYSGGISPEPIRLSNILLILSCVYEYLYIYMYTG